MIRVNWWLLGAAVVGLGVAIAVTYLLAPQVGEDTADAAAVLALITGAAVAIERGIESVWVVIGSWKGTYWPMGAIADAVDEIESSLGHVVGDFFDQTGAAIEQAAIAGKWTAAQLAAVQADLTAKRAEVEASLAEISAAAPSKQRSEMLSATVLAGVNFVEAKYRGLAATVETPLKVANQSLEGASDFIATFKENPGRRLLSIWLGALAGLAVAGFLGLDVFNAVLGERSAGNLGVVATGLVIGLGASPTHEVIKILQENKKARKISNSDSPQV